MYNKHACTQSQNNPTHHTLTHYTVTQHTLTKHIGHDVIADNHWYRKQEPEETLKHVLKNQSNLWAQDEESNMSPAKLKKQENNVADKERNK